MTSFIRRAGAELHRLFSSLVAPPASAQQVTVWSNDAAGVANLSVVDDAGTNTTLTPVTSFSVVGDLTFGPGTDGAVVFDGAATVLGLAPVASVYTLTRNIYPSSLTVNAGVAIDAAGYAIYVNGTATINGTIRRNGNAASGATGGTALAAAILPGAPAGANAATNSVGSAGGNSTTAPFGFSATSATGGATGLPGGAGGIGGGGGGGGGGGVTGLAGGNSGNANVGSATLSTDWMRPDTCLLGKNFNSWTLYTGGTGGGSGGGASLSGTGGGGGGGGGWIIITARSFAGSGTISARGGNGANGTVGDGGGGGGGGGGVIVCVSADGTFVTLDVSGGAGGAGRFSGAAGGAGGSGMSLTWSLRP